jgi:ABC-type uncharacterized transport system substrate-binding protein
VQGTAITAVTQGVRLIIVLLLAATAQPLTPLGAYAHPHVWAKSSIEILHSGDGVFQGVRHAWTFDEMFSTFATYGLAKKDGKIASDQLAALAERYVRSLKAYDYFTYAKQDGRPLPLAEPVNAAIEFDGSVLTLRFLLPSVANAKIKKLELEVYDSTYFVDLTPDEAKPATLGPPAENCRVSSGKRSPGRYVDESLLSSLAASGNWAAEFAITVSVECQ